MGEEVNIKVFNLNCYGLKFVSKFRKERFKAIAEFLSTTGAGYDIVFLQEVWTRGDYDTLKASLCPTENEPDPYPYTHYFNNGIIGSGTCIFSKHRLLRANYHAFSMNGSPTFIWHGDWFASKGIGVCQIRIESSNNQTKDQVIQRPDFFDVHLYISHYHANYDGTDTDRYLGHRVLHAFESAQWLNLTSSSADMVIYAGDFNTEPNSLPYEMLSKLPQLKDAWKVWNGDNTTNKGCTSETPNNSFTPAPKQKSCCRNDPEAVVEDEGKRIDYIMYGDGPRSKVTLTNCSFPLPDRVPGKEFSFSDHEAIDAEFILKRITQVTGGVRTEEKDECLKVVDKAIAVMDKTLKANVRRGTGKYAIYSLLCFAGFVMSFAPDAYEDLSSLERIYLDIGLFIPRMLLVFGVAIFALMGTLFVKREKHALTETTSQLNLIKENDAKTLFD